MLGLFKRKKFITPANPLQDKAAGMVVAKVLWLQGKFALFMDRKVNRLSVRSKKFGLMVFVGLSVLICVSILIETFTGSHKASSLKIGHIHKQSMSNGEVRVSSSIPESQYKRIVAFHYYMDSLSFSASGRKVYDSITRCRPGLLDSAKQLENLYHSQNK